MEREILKFVYGDKSRIFANTAIGCEAKCTYCYLSKLGINKEIIYISAEEAIKFFEAMHSLVPGRNGTIISIGCYSECWDKKNKKETIKLIKYFVKLGNYIQLATKRQITFEELQILDNLAQYNNQIGIFISVPTITQSKVLENGTDSIEKRLSPLQYLSSLNNIYCVLYIKPVISNITVLDCELYKKLLNTYDVFAVVGPMLVITEKKKSDILVGEGIFCEQKCDDNNYLLNQLKPTGRVYEHSIELINEIRKRGTKDGCF